MTDSKSQVRNFLSEQLRQRQAPVDFSDEDSLFLSGRLDSLAAMRLIVYLEERFALQSAQKIHDLSQIDSLERIVRLLDQR